MDPYGYGYFPPLYYGSIPPQMHGFTCPSESTIYFNPQFPLHETAINYTPPIATKVLINPNFRTTTVHVNPNFNKGNSVANKSVIHVNPNILRVSPMYNLDKAKQEDTSQKKKPIETVTAVDIPKIEEPKSNSMQDKVIVSTHNKWIRTQAPLTTTASNTKLFQSTYKIVNRNNVQEKFSPQLTTSKDNPTTSGSFEKKRRLSFHSDYKIIRRNVSSKDEKKEKAKLLYKSKFKLIRNTSPVKKATKIAKVKTTNNLVARKIIRNGGVYTKLISLNQLQYKMVKKSNSSVLLNKSKKLVLIQGNKNKINKSAFALKNSSVVRNKFKIINRKSGAIENKKKKQIQRGSKLKKVNISSSKLRKSNVACPYYRKLGKCKGKENGQCIKKHNPDQISMCPRFLQGACINDKCLLSHKVLPEKMPTCKFFLEGLCTKSDCPYLHVKISPKADICKKFLEGFCEKATKCNNRHQYLCPDFEKRKSCPRMRCPYPHGSRVRNISLVAVAKKFKMQVKNAVKPPRASTFETIHTQNICDSEKQTIRYYTDIQSNEDTKNNSTDQNYVCNNSSSKDNVQEIRKRPALGVLPSFIPFNEQKDT